MKKTVFSLLAMIAASQMALAQSSTSSTTSVNNYDDMSAQGVRVGLVRPTLDFRATAEAFGQKRTEKAEIGDTTGISIGYASLPVQQLGWLADIAFLRLKDGGTENMTRISGNLAYAYTTNVHVKGGLNISNFTDGRVGSDEFGFETEAGIGAQFGLGFQINKNFGIDVGYTLMRQTTNVSFVDVELEESGLEIGINGTF